VAGHVPPNFLAYGRTYLQKLIEIETSNLVQTWCYMLDANKRKCYVGICYRTPTFNIYGSHDHDLMRELITELRSTKKHFVLMGDFNYRSIKYKKTNTVTHPKQHKLFFLGSCDRTISLHLQST